MSGIWICHAVAIGPAPSMRAASITSTGMLFSAPYMMMIQPPAPVQKAISVKMTGRLSSATVCTKVSNPNAFRMPETGLTVGSRRNSHSMTLEAPARAPGM